MVSPLDATQVQMPLAVLQLVGVERLRRTVNALDVPISLHGQVRNDGSWRSFID